MRMSSRLYIVLLTYQMLRNPVFEYISLTRRYAHHVALITDFAEIAAPRMFPGRLSQMHNSLLWLNSWFQDGNEAPRMSGNEFINSMWNGRFDCSSFRSYCGEVRLGNVCTSSEALELLSYNTCARLFSICPNAHCSTVSFPGKNLQTHTRGVQKFSIWQKPTDAIA